MYPGVKLLCNLEKGVGNKLRLDIISYLIASYYLIDLIAFITILLALTHEN